MSIRVMSVVWEVPLPDSEKLVLLALADCANDEGSCWPSMKTLSDKCSKSDRTIQAAIKELVAKGHLSRIEKPGKGCLYYVHPVRPSGMEGTNPTAFHYTYRITCAETGDFYVGARSSYDSPDADRYMGSGEWVKKAKAEGLSLRKEVLATFPSREALAIGEQELTKAVISHPLCRNKKVASARNLSPFGGVPPEAASPRNDFTPQRAAHTPEAASPTPEAASDKPSLKHQEPKNEVKASAHRFPVNWQPAPLPASVQALVDLWPPGRLDREVEQFRDYWLDRTEKRPGWDRTFHNRIRDIHDRVLRESRNGRQPQQFARPALVDIGRSVAADLEREAQARAGF